MRFCSIVVSGLLTLASAAPLAPGINTRSAEDAASIVNAIKNVQAKVSTFDSTVASFRKGQMTGILTVLQISSQSSELSDAVTGATNAANAAQSLDTDKSNSVVLAVIALQPDISSLLNNLQSKKPAFDTVILGIGSVSPQIEQTLQQQKAQSADLGTAITAKLSEPYKGLAPLVTGQVSTAFDQAIATFSQSCGLFALPPLPLDEFQKKLKSY